MNNSFENEIIFVKKGFELIKEVGWDNFSIKKMSKTLKIPNDELKKIFSCKNSIINKFSIMIDNNVETMVSVNDFKDSSTKDILFELIMLRFDEMEDYKDALKSILKNTRKNPLLLSIISKNLLNTMDFYLELSNAYKSSPFEFYKKNFLLLIYSLTFKIWLEDNTEDLSKTMAELDKLLSMAQSLQKNIKNFLPI